MAASAEGFKVGRVGIVPYADTQETFVQRVEMALEAGLTRFDLMASNVEQTEWLGEVLARRTYASVRPRLAFALILDKAEYQHSEERLIRVVSKHAQALRLERPLNAVLLRRDDKASTSSDEALLETWGRFEQLLLRGHTYQIGCCGLHCDALRVLLRGARFPPSIELVFDIQPRKFYHFHDKLRLCRRHAITVLALQAMHAKIDVKQVASHNVALVGLAGRYRVRPEVLVAQWLVQLGIAVSLPSMMAPRDILSFAVVGKFAMSVVELAQMSAAPPWKSASDDDESSDTDTEASDA